MRHPADSSVGPVPPEPLATAALVQGEARVLFVDGPLSSVKATTMIPEIFRTAYGKLHEVRKTMSFNKKSINQQSTNKHLSKLE